MMASSSSKKTKTKTAEIKRCRFASKDSIQFDHPVYDESDRLGWRDCAGEREHCFSFDTAFALLASSSGPPPPGEGVARDKPRLPQAGSRFLLPRGNNEDCSSDGYEWKTALSASQVDPRTGKTVLAKLDVCVTSPSLVRETYHSDSHVYISYLEKQPNGNLFYPGVVAGAKSESLQRTAPEAGSGRRPPSSSSSTPFLEASSSSSQLWSDELISLSEELASGKVVKNLTVFPSLQMTLVHPDMTKEFENCCKIFGPDSLDAYRDEGNDDEGVTASSGIKLFYDTTFAFGRLYATVLTFVNGCYEGNPVMPLAVNLHERKFKSSHQLFWARIVGDLPALQKYRFPLIIDDAEPAVHLAVRTQAPNLVQLEAWTHRFRDIDSHMKAKGYGEEAVHYFKACISYLLHSESKQAMHDRFRKEFESVWPKDFVYYYRQKLLPRSGRLGQWAMLKMKIRDELFLCPHTNPQVEFHLLCQNFCGWDAFSTEQLVRAFYFLFLFYVSETYESRSVAGGGDAKNFFKLKRQLSSGNHSLKGHHLRASYKYIPHPSEISRFILQNYPKRPPSRPQWLAYGATEVFAAGLAGGRSTSLSNYSNQEMEDVCDIQSELKDFLRGNDLAQNSAAAATLDDFAKLKLLDSLGGGGGGYPSHPPDPLEAVFSGLPPPPSPAPNGTALSPPTATSPPPLHHEDLDSKQAKATGLFTSGLTPIPEVPQHINHHLHRSGPHQAFNNNDHNKVDVHYGGPVDRRFDGGQLEEDPPLPGADSLRRPSPPKEAGGILVAANPPDLHPSRRPPPPATTSSSTTNLSTESGLPSSMMLWKKVQHCVVFGGSFITANKEAAKDAIKQ